MVFELFPVMNVGVTMRAVTSQHKSRQYNTLRSRIKESKEVLCRMLRVVRTLT